MLYNRFTQRLLTYNTATRHTVEVSNVPNYIQYSFNTPSDIFTAGHSAGDGFSVLSVKDQTIRTVVTMPRRQGIFPLATDGTVTFFLVSEYDANGGELNRTLATVTEQHKVRRVPAVAGLISAGALLNGRLYYTVLDEATNDYALYSFAYGEASAAPQQVAVGLKAPELYVHLGHLYTSTGTKLVSDNTSFNCADLCYFFDTQSLLIGMRTSQDGMLTIDATDTNTNEVLMTSDGVIDFSVKDDVLTVYRTGAIDRVVISELKAK